MIGKDAELLIELYPRIFLACHVRHVRDPESQRLITGNQAEILDHLDADEQMGLNELANHMGVKPSTMSVAVDRLVELGYVSRQSSPTDRRRVLITLTPAGERIVREHRVLDPARVEAMLGLIPEEERTAALQGLHRIAAAADRLRRERGEGWSYLQPNEDDK